MAVTDCTETPAGATVLAKEGIQWGRSASGRIVHLWVRHMGPAIRPGVVIQLR